MLSHRAQRQLQLPMNSYEFSNKKKIEKNRKNSESVKMPPSRKMSLPFDQRIKPERKMQLKVALMNWARDENKKQQGKTPLT